ncbi:hypothetical protein GW17_00025028 [Ensete ventricosum]|nr:hypothetical protein GW17_00025028 [Ensete ventricosum]
MNPAWSARAQRAMGNTECGSRDEKDERGGEASGEKEEGDEDQRDVEVDGAEPEDEGDDGLKEGVFRPLEHRRLAAHASCVAGDHFVVTVPVGLIPHHYSIRITFSPSKKREEGGRPYHRHVVNLTQGPPRKYISNGEGDGSTWWIDDTTKPR